MYLKIISHYSSVQCHMILQEELIIKCYIILLIYMCVCVCEGINKKLIFP